MSRQATGSIRYYGGCWRAIVTLRGSSRCTVQLTTCPREVEDQEKARARARLLAEQACLLRAAEKPVGAELARTLLQLIGGSDDRHERPLEAIRRLSTGEAAPPPVASMTFAEFGYAWTSGELRSRYPDHIKKKKTATQDARRLENHVYPVIGTIPLEEITLDHALAVMERLPAHLKPASRRHVAQVMARVLTLAHFPARVITANPLPKGFLPKLADEKAYTFLYPDEDRALLGCRSIPLHFRLLYGFMAREGMRRSEASDLAWADVDLERGAVALVENKTREPRAWALRPDCARALRAWRARRGGDGRVFVDEAGEPLITRGDGRATPRFREQLRSAGIDRPELYERSETRQPIRLHDLRATFITIALANEKTETWVADRTGHRSSAMINRYRRAARLVAELGLGDLADMDRAIPELSEVTS